MTIVYAIILIIAAFAVEKLIRFFFAGGTLTQPARNATFMYRQIKIVYDRMPDEFARFMALFLNSASARDEMQESLLRSMVDEFKDKPWADLCEAYAWMYAARLGHVDLSRLSSSLYDSRCAKIREQIAFAEFAVEHGDRRYESKLRSLSQDAVLVIIAKAKGHL